MSESGDISRLIGDLSADLKPVRRLAPPWLRALYWLAAVLGLALVLIAIRIVFNWSGASEVDPYVMPGAIASGVTAALAAPGERGRRRAAERRACRSHGGGVSYLIHPTFTSPQVKGHFRVDHRRRHGRLRHRRSWAPGARHDHGPRTPGTGSGPPSAVVPGSAVTCARHNVPSDRQWSARKGALHEVSGM